MNVKMSKPVTFRSDRPLSNDTIACYAPSVFADSARDDLGHRYAFIPTIDVVEGMRAEGFEPYEVRQTRVRNPDNREFTRHMLRMRHATALRTGDGVGEIILLNSHDGTSSFQLMSGFFRMVCSNGIIAGDVAADCRVRHTRTSHVVQDVTDAAFRVIDDLKNVGNHIEQFKAIPMTHDQQVLFAGAALQLRYDDKAPVQATHLLTARRWEDRKDDLWTTFNRVQENMLKGGVQGRTATGRNMSTRAVGGVNENVKLNKALWVLAEGYAQLAGIK